MQKVYLDLTFANVLKTTKWQSSDKATYNLLFEANSPTKSVSVLKSFRRNLAASEAHFFRMISNLVLRNVLVWTHQRSSSLGGEFWLVWTLKGSGLVAKFISFKVSTRYERYDQRGGASKTEGNMKNSLWDHIKQENEINCRQSERLNRLLKFDLCEGQVKE